MEFIYETPWWLPTGLMLVGAVVFWTGNSRMEKKVRTGGLAFLSAGLVLALVSYFLQSDREIVQRQTQQLVAAVEARDWPTMEKLMAPDVTILVWRGREDIITGARNYCEQFKLKKAWISGMEASKPDPNIDVTIRVFADTAEVSSFPTDWHLEWEKMPEGWRLTEIRPAGAGAPINLERYFQSKPR
jgi:hypothetical protein